MQPKKKAVFLTQALTKEWYSELEKQSETTFINLPIEFQIRDYSYASISKSYLNFFKGTENTRGDKLTLARKFLKFVRSINKNRAKQELDESFFECFQYFMDNFSDLMSKQDSIHLETLSVLTEAIDKSQFIEDIISVEDLHRRVSNLNKTLEREEIIDLKWDEFEEEYNDCQMSKVRAITQVQTPKLDRIFPTKNIL